MEGAATFLLTQGVLGVATVVLGAVVVSREKKIDKLQSRIDELQEARRLDAVETREQVTSILPNLSQSLQNISDKIEISKEKGR